MLLLIQIVVTIRLHPRNESAVLKSIFSKVAYSVKLRLGSPYAVQIRIKTLYSEFCLPCIYSFCTSESFLHFVEV